MMKKISVKFLLLVFLSGFAQLGLLRSVLSQDVFDSYKSNISWINERVHLDNFAIELRKSPEMVGYIAFYTNEKTSLKKIKARINRARRYLINYRKVEEKRCDGQEKQETKLSLLLCFLIFNCFSNSIGLK
jgi:hypothetical protein